MPTSLKELIKNNDNGSSGIFSFTSGEDLNLRIANKKREVILKYEELEQLELEDAEINFAQDNWNEIKRKNPKFYDGNVTAIMDIIYEPADSTLTFIMEKTKYSNVSAINHPDYPNTERSKKILGFGIGLMSNLSVNPDGSLVMVERSQHVHSEKGAFSVPGGSLEYKEGEKDDVEDGLEKAALGEVIEEVLSEKYRDHKFKINLSSIYYEKNDKGRVGLNAFFNISSQDRGISRREIIESFKNAQDREFESTGRIFFVDPSTKVDSIGTQDLYATPRDMIESGKLEASGKSALASQVYKELTDSYNRGVYSGFAPHPTGISNILAPGDNFSIFDIVKMCNFSVEKPLSSTQANSFKILKDREEQIQSNK